jgi:hypothetical protein
MKIEWNKVTWYSKLLAIIIFVLTFYVGFILGNQNGGKNNTNYVLNNYQNNLAVKNNNLENQKDLICHESSNYLAISRPMISSPGSDLLIKYKASASQKIPCNYFVEKNDFELKNNGGSNYFMGLEGKFLIMDSGTAVNNRGITVYDLSKQDKVFSDLYSSGEPVIDNNTITYWTNTNELTTIENCPQLYNSGGAIVSQVFFDFSTLIKKDLGNIRCVYQE